MNKLISVTYLSISEISNYNETRMKRNVLIIFLIIQVFNGLSQSTIFYADTLNFEEPCNYLFIDTSSTNLWQIGIPNKTILDSAYSKPFAILTDSSNYYSPDNHSIFILKLEPESIEAGGQTSISFWHKFDTDSINDYGVVEVSYDEGNAWNVLCTDTTYNIYFLRNDLWSETHLATGQSNGWVNDNITFDFYLVGTGNPENIWLRFSFYSDSVPNEKEGWMIDNIQIIGSMPWGIKENIDINSLPYPNPTGEIINFNFQNTNTKYNIELYDPYGQIVKEVKNIQTSHYAVNVADLKAGVYFYVISDEDIVLQQGKVVVK